MSKHTEQHAFGRREQKDVQERLAKLRKSGRIKNKADERRFKTAIGRGGQEATAFIKDVKDRRPPKQGRSRLERAQKAARNALKIKFVKKGEK